MVGRLVQVAININQLILDTLIKKTEGKESLYMNINLEMFMLENTKKEESMDKVLLLGKAVKGI